MENYLLFGLPSYTHVMQPYGWVKMRDCRVESREETYVDYNNGRKARTRHVTYVVGTVEASSYCGALLCGVPVVNATEKRYPPGSVHECRIRNASDLDRRQTVDVAM